MLVAGDVEQNVAIFTVIKRVGNMLSGWAFEIEIRVKRSRPFLTKPYPCSRRIVDIGTPYVCRERGHRFVVRGSLLALSQDFLEMVLAPMRNGPCPDNE